MPRIARVVVPDALHHVTQRGNNRQDVYLTDGDREFYLGLLRQRSRRHGLEVLGYCLMTNHVHLLVRPQTAESLALTLGRTHFIYAQRFNAEHSRSGHLWQARFYSCPAEDGALFTIMRYVEQNPVRAGIVGRAWEYPWSSAAAHVGESKDESKGSGLVDTASWAAQIGPDDWRRALQEAEDPIRVAEIRRRTLIGRPFGSSEFINEVEGRLDRQLMCRPAGRPRKTRTE
jgi:putative transposase